MKKYFFRATGLAALTLLLHVPGFSQQSDSVRTEQPSAVEQDSDTFKDYDEIIIRRNNDKDTKVSVEIRDGKVFINGKPSSEYKDDNITVRRRKVKSFGGNNIISEDDMGGFEALRPLTGASPFRSHGGTMSFNRDWNDSPGKERAFLGVTSESNEDGNATRITQISKGSAAEKAGLKEGDLITRIDEVKVDGPETLSEAVRKYKPEAKVTVTYLRNGKEQKATAILGKTKTTSISKSFNYSLPNMENMNLDMDIAPRAYNYSYGMPKAAKLGIKAQDTEDGKGVKVLEVGEESAAEKAGIKEGDIITRFDGKEVDNATALGAMARSNRDKSSFKLSLIRDGRPMEIEVKIPRKLRTADL